MKESPDRPLADDDVEKRLFPAPGLPGGGQLEVRMEAPLLHPDPDVREVARRYKPYNLDSWHTEWTLMAEKNEALAAGFEDEGRKVTAHDFYRRAAEFYRRALVYMPDSDPRMMRSHHKLTETFDKAWSLVAPPFERVEIPYEGHVLDALFYPARGKAGTRLPTVYNYGGADGILLRGLDGDAGQYVRRGMSFIDVDGPGHGATLREKKLYAPPDSERVAKAVIDYLVTRPGRGPGPRRPPRLQHGRLFRTPVRHRGKTDQGRGRVERRLPPGGRHLRLLSAHPGPAALADGRERPQGGP